MAKAVLVTKGGATVTLEGSQEEVGAMLMRLEGGAKAPSHQQSESRPSGRITPSILLLELKAEGFFSHPKELGQVGSALRERGHFYPPTTLSPLMLRLVRRKELRRLKEKNRWTYVA